MVTIEIEEGAKNLIYIVLKIVTILILCPLTFFLYSLRGSFLPERVRKALKLDTHDAMEQHKYQGFYTLQSLLKDFYDKRGVRNPSNIQSIMMERIQKEMSSSHKIFTQLNIDIPPKEMKDLYERYGIIALRKLSQEGLLVCCGNSPIFSCCMHSFYGKAPIDYARLHEHSEMDTCDEDFLMNPSVVGTWLTPGLVQYLADHRREKKYHILTSENPSVGLIKQENGTFRDFKDLSLFLSKSALINNNHLDRNDEESFAKCRDHGFTLARCNPSN